jgi:hypothetical protein
MLTASCLRRHICDLNLDREYVSVDGSIILRPASGLMHTHFLIRANTNGHFLSIHIETVRDVLLPIEKSRLCTTGSQADAAALAFYMLAASWEPVARGSNCNLANGDVSLFCDFLDERGVQVRHSPARRRDEHPDFRSSVLDRTAPTRGPVFKWIFRAS